MRDGLCDFTQILGSAAKSTMQIHEMTKFTHAKIHLALFFYVMWV